MKGDFYRTNREPLMIVRCAIVLIERYVHNIPISVHYFT